MAYSTDLTWRTDRNGNVIASSKNEKLINQVQMLFMMHPGDDEYDLDRGLDIISKAQTTYVNGERDTEYENKIVTQFSTYTSIVPSNVVVVYTNNALVIAMNMTYEGEMYTVQVTGDSTSLKSLIVQ